MTDRQYIEVRGARENNLKDVSLDIPKQQITVFTGVSGSGKSSLVFDTLYAEGQPATVRPVRKSIKRCAVDFRRLTP